MSTALIAALGGARDDAHARPLVSYTLIRAHLYAALACLAVSMAAGFLYSLQFLGFYPDCAGELFSPGHMRLWHTNLAAYGWLVNGFTGMLYYAVPRLTGERVLSEGLGKLIFWAWQAILVLAAIGYLTDHAQAIEWGETPTGFRPGTFELVYVPVDLLVTVGAVLLIVQFMTPLWRARHQKYYVTLWYFTAGLVWLALTYLMGNVLPEWVLPGASGAAVTGLFIHDLVGLYVTPMGWGLMYFFVPLILRRPIWSHSLSVIGFWALAFFYPLGGVHHFLLSPIPDYVEFGAISTTIAIEIVVTTVVVNFFMSLRGSWDKLRTSFALRWFYTGAVMYMITCFQCAFQTTWTFQKIIHFTDWVVAHAHLIMLGTFTFWMYGVIDWLWPRVTGRRWYSTSLRSWHYWLSAIGILLMFTSLTAGGLVAGFMQKELNPWEQIVDAQGPFWLFRTATGALLIVGLLCQAYNMLMTAKAGAAFVEEEGPLESAENAA